MDNNNNATVECAGTTKKELKGIKGINKHKKSEANATGSEFSPRGDTVQVEQQKHFFSNSQQRITLSVKIGFVVTDIAIALMNKDL